MTDHIDTSHEAVDFDVIAYRFWSIHPRDIPDPVGMPSGYKGGARAWMYATDMRDAFRALSAERDRNAAIAIKALERATLAEEWRDHDKARAEKAEANLEHWRHEVGKLHSKVDRLTAENAALRDVLTVVRNNIPMGYLQRHDIAGATGPTANLNIGAAMRDFAEDRWKRIEKLRAALAASQPRKTDTNGG